MPGALPTPGSQDGVSIVEIRKSSWARTSQSCSSITPTSKPRLNWAATSGPEAVYGSGRFSKTTNPPATKPEDPLKDETHETTVLETEHLARQYIVFRTPRFTPSAHKTKSLLAVRCAEHATRVAANRHA